MLKTVSTQAITGSLSYQGTWNANTNVPTLVSSVGTQNWYYVVSTAGNTTLNGVSNWNVGDWAVFNGSVWEKIDGSNLGTMAYQNANLVAITGGTVFANISGSYGLPSGNVTGLGTMATQNANAVAITGGTINTTTINTGTFVNANISSVSTTFPNSYLANASATIGNTAVTLGSTVSSLGNVTLANVTITGGTINVQATNHTATTNANATMSTASIPLVPQGYMLYDLNGTVVKIPYYAV